MYYLHLLTYTVLSPPPPNLMSAYVRFSAPSSLLSAADMIGERCLTLNFTDSILALKTNLSMEFISNLGMEFWGQKSVNIVAM